ncbi:SGNH/GDSL hydrolase family protein [Rubrolithibacter danxiaensis]|uniref:SGNH/GDSL hydrolase family protein n=1 Tax=Rubrolithibacter danxiaensis TaxID=3390805 RepID=UPI003BF7D532
MKLLFAVILVICLGCSNEEKEVLTPSLQLTNEKSLNFLALGDSYTIGTSVSPAESYPYQLSDSVKTDSITLKKVKIIAQNGWTTADLIQALEKEQPEGKFDIVTLLIGVNNQFQRGSIERYEKEFKELLDRALKYSGGVKSHVFVLSIPDYGVTPFGGNDPEISKEIDAFNTANKNITETAGINYVDITSISRLAKNDSSLLARDGLHPSAKMYAMWVEKLKEALLKQDF